jgi:hypothetical protein
VPPQLRAYSPELFVPGCIAATVPFRLQEPMQIQPNGQPSGPEYPGIHASQVVPCTLPL